MRVPPLSAQRHCGEYSLPELDGHPTCSDPEHTRPVCARKPIGSVNDSRPFNHLPLSYRLPNQYPPDPVRCPAHAQRKRHPVGARVPFCVLRVHAQHALRACAIEWMGISIPPLNPSMTRCIGPRRHLADGAFTTAFCGRAWLGSGVALPFSRVQRADLWQQAMAAHAAAPPGYNWWRIYRLDGRVRWRASLSLPPPSDRYHRQWRVLLMDDG